MIVPAPAMNGLRNRYHRVPRTHRNWILTLRGIEMGKSTSKKKSPKTRNLSDLEATLRHRGYTLGNVGYNITDEKCSRCEEVFTRNQHIAIRKSDERGFIWFKYCLGCVGV